MGRDRMRLALLAGWLFADLFLVLLLAGLADLPASRGDQAGDADKGTTAEPVKEGLEPKPLEFTIDFAPEPFNRDRAGTLIDRVKERVDAAGYEGRDVGFVLVFATGENPGTAQRIANRAYDRLQKEEHFTKSAGYGYWGGSGSEFEFKIFFLN